MEVCHHCKETVGHNPRWVYINGIKRYFHSAIGKDCLNAWNQQRDNEIAVAKRRTISNVVLQHGG